MSGNTRRPLGRIVVAGRGIVALLAALALRRALPAASVTLVTAPPDPADLAERLPVLFPAAGAAAERIGFDADRLAVSGLANHRLADGFAAWGSPESWLHAFGMPGGSVGEGAFHQLWLAARRRSAARPFHHYLPAAVLAEAGHFAPDAVRDGSALAQADYALRLHPGQIAPLLARQLAGARIAVSPAPLARAVPAGDGTLADLQLEDGSRIGADLYLDCTGAPARLIGALGGEWHDWADATGVDRLLVSSAPTEAAPILDRYRANEIGWQAVLPQPGGAITYGAWRAAEAGQGRARRLLGTGAGGELVAIAPGRRGAPFSGNVVALGTAAAQPGPMLATGLSLAVLQLDLLVELLPGMPFLDVERAEFNRRAALLADRARDLAALPLLAAPRTAGPFWSRMASTSPPPSLASALVQFRRRGLLPRPEADIVDPDSWRAILLGLGVMPELPDPIAAGADPATLDANLDQLARHLAALAAQVPPCRAGSVR